MIAFWTRQRFRSFLHSDKKKVNTKRAHSSLCFGPFHNGGSAEQTSRNIPDAATTFFSRSNSLRRRIVNVRKFAPLPDRHPRLLEGSLLKNTKATRRCRKFRESITPPNGPSRPIVQRYAQLWGCWAKLLGSRSRSGWIGPSHARHGAFQGQPTVGERGTLCQDLLFLLLQVLSLATLQEQVPSHWRGSGWLSSGTDKNS